MDVVGDGRLTLARPSTARSPEYMLAGRALTKVAGPCIISMRALASSAIPSCDPRFTGTDALRGWWTCRISMTARER